VTLLTLGTIAAGIWRREKSRWVSWLSLALVGFGVVLTLSRTVPNATTT
jgi:hypothetical protein